MSLEEVECAFPLHRAAHRGDLATVRKLLECTESNARATGGATPLHAAGVQPCDLNTTFQRVAWFRLMALVRKRSRALQSPWVSQSFWPIFPGSNSEGRTKCDYLDTCPICNVAAPRMPHWSRPFLTDSRTQVYCFTSCVCRCLHNR
jgi:hypothetical protein